MVWVLLWQRHWFRVVWLSSDVCLLTACDWVRLLYSNAYCYMISMSPKLCRNKPAHKGCGCSILGNAA